MLRARLRPAVSHVVVARATFSITTGPHAVSLRLTASARRALLRRSPLATVATVTTSRASGNVSRTARLTLRRRR